MSQESITVHPLVKSLPSLEEAEKLYNENRFIDLYNLTKKLWESPEIVPDLGIEQIVFASRLALRLGSQKIARALGRLAIQKAPNNPYVRYFCRTYARHRTSLFETLKEFESTPELKSGNLDLDASWLASHASLLAQVRDFQSAFEVIKRAKHLGARDGWVTACEAAIYLQKGSWDEAIVLAEQAWQESPGLPYAASLLGATLHSKGQTQKAVEILLKYHRKEGQSWENLDTAINYAQALLENPSDSQDDVLSRQELEALPKELFTLAPLYDRAHERHFSVVQAQISLITRNRDSFVQAAQKARTVYLDTTLKNLEKNPEGQRVILPHTEIHQQHKTCLPASLVTCASVFGLEFDHEEIAKKITYDGTPLWRVIDWAKENNWTARPFIGDAQSVKNLIDQGLPFIYTFASHSFAHAVAAIGIDHGLGTLIYHDPTSGRLCEVLLDFFNEDEAPLGPQCIAIAPEVYSDKLQAVELRSEDFALATIESRKTFEIDSSSQARERIQGFVQQNPDSIEGRYLKAWAELETGNAKKVADSLKEDLKEHPNCHLLQQLLLNAAWSSGDTAYYRSLLESIVKRKRQPSHTIGMEWVYPDPLFQVRFASMLLYSEEHRQEAEELLNKALYRNPFLSEGYFHLGNELWRKGQKEEALLPYRLASTLEPEQESYAENYAWALKKLGRMDEAVTSLRLRVNLLKSESGGGGTWRTLILALEDFGFPDDALNCLHEGLEKRPDDVELSSFAVSFLARYGRFEDAEKILEHCKKICSKEVYLSTASHFYFSRGKIRYTFEHVKQWLKETPRDSQARNLWVQLLTIEKGPETAGQTIKKWLNDHPGDEYIEELYLLHLREVQKPEERLGILQHRVQRNPLDAWAFAELAWDEWDRLRALSKQKLVEAKEDFKAHVKAYCDLQPDSVQSLGLEGELALLEEDTEHAIACFNQALLKEPGYSYAIQRLFDVTHSRAPKEKLSIVRSLDRAFENTVHDLSQAKNAAMLIAQNIDRETALEALHRWSQSSPDDPMVIEARADIQIQYGTGRDSIESILPQLELAVARFPLHHNLAFSLADAYQNLCRFPEAVQTYQKLLEFQPGLTHARICLASALERLGKIDESLKQLELARDHNRRNPQTWSCLSDWYQRHDQVQVANEVLAEACEKIPWAKDLWTQRIELLQSWGKPQEALKVARQLAETDLKNATSRLIVARTYWRLGFMVPRKTIEAEFETSLKLDARFWEAVWDYAMYLCDQADFEKAYQVIENYRHLEPDEICPKGAIACIQWREGQTTQAIRQMRELLKECPDYYFGWYTLLDWIEEEGSRNAGALNITPEILESMPEKILEDATLALRKLLLLEVSTNEVQKVKSEWEKLAHSHPGTCEVHLRYFDFLVRNDFFEEAKEVLHHYEERGSHTPQLVARKICLAVWHEDSETALTLTEDLFTRDGWVDRSAIDLAMDGLRQGKLATKALKRLLAIFKSNLTLSDTAFREILHHFSAQGFKNGFADLLTLLNPTKTQNRYIEKFELTLQYYVEAGGAQQIIKWGESNKSLFRERRKLWEIMGRAYSILEQDDEVLEWLKDWKERTEEDGVSQWLLNQYAAACFCKGTYDKAMEVCLYSLANSFYDSTAPNLVEIFLRSALQTGKYEAYLKFYDKFKSVSYQAYDRIETVESLRYIAELLKSKTPEEALAIHQESRPYRLDAHWPAVYWNEIVLERLPFLKKLFFKIGFYGR